MNSKYREKIRKYHILHLLLENMCSISVSLIVVNWLITYLLITRVSLWLPSTIVVLDVLFMTIRTSTPGSGDPTAPVNKSSRNTHKNNMSTKWRYSPERKMGWFLSILKDTYMGSNQWSNHHQPSVQDFYPSRSALFQDAANLHLQGITGH